MATRWLDEKAYAEHQLKVARYNSIDPKALDNLPAKRPNRRKNMTPEQVVEWEKKFIAQYGHPPRGPDRAVRPKYCNEVVIDENGYRHASRKEMRRYKELHLLLKSGEISFLARQVQFILPGGIQYVADFVMGVSCQSELGFGTNTFERIVVEDVKSVATLNLTSYRMKKKLMLSTYGIEIQEV